MKYLIPDYEELVERYFEKTPNLYLKYMIPDYHDLEFYLRCMDAVRENKLSDPRN